MFHPVCGRPLPPSHKALAALEFFNGIGGFAESGREYVIVQGPGQTTPLPWINVIANGGFGFQVSADGAGFTSAANSREHQLTPWSNDPVGDPSGQAFYIRDAGDPAAMAARAPLSNRVGAGLDPCGAMQTQIELADGASIEIVCLLGEAVGDEAARALIEHYRAADLDAVLAEVTGDWADVLGAVEVTTPDRSLDIMLNGWLLYQTLACRIRARAGFYQASGAYGFRDQLQDVMAVASVRPAIAHAQIVRAAGRQFIEGDVQHWWLPQAGNGVRTRFADDRVWLALVTAHYLAATGNRRCGDFGGGYCVPRLPNPGR